MNDKRIFSLFMGYGDGFTFPFYQTVALEAEKLGFETIWTQDNITGHAPLPRDIEILDTGGNYNCETDEIVIEPSFGAKLSIKGKCENFGRIPAVDILDPGLGFDRWPQIRVISPTGVNFEAVPIFEVVRDPIVVDPAKLIQVTDLVGLKQTGYYQGRPYYGAVFYKDGIRYAGWYETPGELVQIYNTLQESIDAEVTTPPSAILKQGSDVSSNDPKLNIPGTPENLT